MANFKKKTGAPKIDVYERVTSAIIAQLENGVRPWSKPWTAKGGSFGNVTFPLNADGRRYRGINVFLLWTAALAGGYVSPYWLTYNKAKALGGNVKKGEKSTLIVFASRFEVDSKTNPGEKDSIFIWKGFSVFNAEQCEGLPVKYHPAPEVVTVEEGETRKAAKIDHAESFFAKIGGKVRHGGDRAFYSPSADFIQLPEFETFRDAESYYATLGHEYAHWTGHKDRLNRDFSGRFGNEAYAAEELVAELGAAFLCADLGLTLEPREDHAAYLASWLKVLKGDKRFILQAASRAQKAADFLSEAAGEGKAAEPISGDAGEPVDAIEEESEADLAKAA